MKRIDKVSLAVCVICLAMIAGLAVLCIATEAHAKSRECIAADMACTQFNDCGGVAAACGTGAPPTNNDNGGGDQGGGGGGGGGGTASDSKAAKFTELEKKQLAWVVGRETDRYVAEQGLVDKDEKIPMWIKVLIGFLVLAVIALGAVIAKMAERQKSSDKKQQLLLEGMKSLDRRIGSGGGSSP
ncbi:hypothetical protein KJ742_06630 [Patescibacteria group bacterium]|nr:hypothetical protein [Patescibacteria group bacterium]MBU1683588.1 hypothetical protein [Patescibacteria group bacterium]